MIEYDFHLALRHGIQKDAPNLFTLYFPNSAILYPDNNSSIPSQLICRVIFPDGSIHTYQVPTIKMQSYSLEAIRQKHLTMFIPFKLLSFRPRLKSSSNPILKSELTAYTNQLIVILKEELLAGNLSTNEYKDYLGLINLAANRVFQKQDHLKQEVLNVTKSVLILPSDLYREVDRAKILEKELKEKDAVLKQQTLVLAALRQKLIDAGINPDE